LTVEGKGVVFEKTDTRHRYTTDWQKELEDVNKGGGEEPDLGEKYRKEQRKRKNFVLFSRGEVLSPLRTKATKKDR